jgi:hypothetical protein
MEQEDLRSDDEEEEAPILLEEVQLEEQVDERLEEEAEAEAETERQQIPPYQLMQYYHNELAHFDEAYLRWTNERYEQERLLFKQQQEQLYNAAMVLGAQVGGQQRRQLEQQNNVPLPVEEHVNENVVDDGNDNIIIDHPVDEEDGIIIRNNPIDDDDFIIINEEERLPNEEEDIIIIEDDVREANDDPDPTVNCQVIREKQGIFKLCVTLLTNPIGTSQHRVSAEIRSS